MQAKAARATDEPANQHNARGARSLFGLRLGIDLDLLRLKWFVRAVLFRFPEKRFVLQSIDHEKRHLSGPRL